MYLGYPKQQVSTNNILDKGLIAEYRKINATWTVTRQSYWPMDTFKFKSVYSYDKTTNGLVSFDYIDLTG